VGRGASADEKKKSMIMATEFLSKQKMPDYTPVR